MKLFSFILSVVVFFVALYYFIEELPQLQTFNDGIYITLLGILMAICITGVFINSDFLVRKRKSRIILFVSNSFSKKNKK
ncbi:hypothetical protein [Flavobacterium coralii]|uniref:hypothetical protein n=1 Tax=Flavobacterium coralii TaxID=2838017 RepID=UPI000C5F75E5|nr:hypothetical protein [Flavobacterium coralii]MBE99810.1 hypothetical protein [Flavobacterium sp.]MBY8961427.1 hypothetical protein [Flavobacterium coralii]|tara:strand:- start:25461 stop:25700 length:240 start_codon:yes stop_codon:yes gene_type:complete